MIRNYGLEGPVADDHRKHGGVQLMPAAVPFPEVRPDGYEWLGDEPVFDPTLHLDIQPPTGVTMLADLGYRLDEIAATATPTTRSAASAGRPRSTTGSRSAICRASTASTCTSKRAA